MENKEIKLRALEVEDLDWFYQLENDVSLWKTNDTLSPLSKHILKQYIEYSHLDIYQTKQLFLAIEAKDTKQTVGIAQLMDFDPFHKRTEIGVVIDKNFRNNGYAYSAITLLLDYAFGFLKVHQCYANVAASNKGSIALFEKLGFELACVKKDWLFWDGYEDVLFFQKINEKY